MRHGGRKDASSLFALLRDDEDFFGKFGDSVWSDDWSEDCISVISVISGFWLDTSRGGAVIR